MNIDDRAIGVERRYTGAPPEVELVVVRLHGRDAELVLDDGDVLVFDAEELRKVLEVPDTTRVDYESVRIAPEILEKLEAEGSEPVHVIGIERHGDGTLDLILRTPEPPADRDCPHCRKGRWTDSNGVERRCAYCGGVGRLAA